MYKKKRCLKVTRERSQILLSLLFLLPITSSPFQTLSIPLRSRSLMIFCQSAENLLAIYDLKSELHILRNVYRFYDGYSSFPPRISLFFYRSK